MADKRIICPNPRCQKFVTLRKDGTIRKHYYTDTSGGGYGWRPRRKVCPASGTKPKEELRDATG